MESLRVGVSVGPYVIESLLREGRGGFSQVVVAVLRNQEGRAERVALKFAKTRASAATRDQAEQLVQAYELALKNEAEILRRLGHPGIVRIFPIPFGNRNMPYVARAADIEGQPWFFCMEYLAGGTVEAAVQTSKLLPVPLAIEIAQQVCFALDYLHSRDYAHLDVKTHNIMLREPLAESGVAQAVLVDFGTAQKRGWSPDVEGGSIVYLPPERLREMQGSIAPEMVLNSAAVDIYCLGVSLYRMLCGCLPFSGSRSHITTAILNEEPTRPSFHNPSLRTHPDLDALILQMMSKRPAARPTARQVAETLDTIAPPPRCWQEAKLPAVRRETSNAWRRATVLLSAVTLLELGGMAFLWQGRPAASGESTPRAVATTALASTATLLAPTEAPPTKPASGATIVIEAAGDATETPQPTPSPSIPPAGVLTSTMQPTHTPTLTRTPRPPTATPSE